MNAPRVLLIVEIFLKLLWWSVAVAVANLWERSFAYHNTLRKLEVTFVGFTMITLFTWRLLLRAHQEVLAVDPKAAPGKAALFYQKWIAPLWEISFLLVIYALSSADLFPV